MFKISYLLVMVLSVVAFVEAGLAAFECNGPVNNQSSAICNAIVFGQQRVPSTECCIAYKNFVETAKTTEERKELCSCFQRNAGSKKASIAHIDALPRKCGMPFIFSADPSFDCNR